MKSGRVSCALTITFHPGALTNDLELSRGVVPYGIYDRNAHRGSIYIGDSKDTPEFAVDCIAKWFSTEGKTRYPNANRLIILADCGGSNSNRAKAWSIFYKKRLVTGFKCR